ncbi:hypothetical protein ABT269_05565 [Streptomyces viridosporus]|uniref:hypothetical protein n=1 Tax=Streptomyces viridosporus TaxID=67581 RepID=UPI0033208E67
MMLPDAVTTDFHPAMWDDRELQRDINRYITRQARPMRPDVFAVILDRTAPDQLPVIVWHAWRRRVVPTDTIGEHLGMAFAHCARPGELLSLQRWLTLFAAVGFRIDGEPADRPDEPTRLYRACLPEHVRRMSWTPSLRVARAYAQGEGHHQPGADRIYTATVQPQHVLGINDDVLANPDETEWIVDPRHLDIHQHEGNPS